MMRRKKKEQLEKKKGRRRRRRKFYCLRRGSTLLVSTPKRVFLFYIFILIFSILIFTCTVLNNVFHKFLETGIKKTKKKKTEKHLLMFLEVEILWESFLGFWKRKAFFHIHFTFFALENEK